MTDKYLSDRQVANLFNISVERLRNKVSDKDPLPDYIEPPGCRVRLWPAEKVYVWLESYTVTSSPKLTKIGNPTSRARRGRPTKSAQMEKMKTGKKNKGAQQ